MEVVLSFFGAWYNWIFVLPLMICALFIFLQVALGILDQDVDHDAEVKQVVEATRAHVQAAAAAVVEQVKGPGADA